MSGGNCYHCGTGLGALDYGREDTCSSCGRDTKVCRNCVHYEPAANNECRENQADRVVDKEKSNFCDYFKPSARPGGNATSRDDLRSAADALFKKK